MKRCDHCNHEYTAPPKVKNSTRKGGKENAAGTLSKQADFRANWTGQAAVVYSIDEALFQVSCV